MNERKVTMKSIIETRLVSSLEKVFADEQPDCENKRYCSMFGNETYSFQAAYKGSQKMGNRPKMVNVRVESPLSSCTTLRKVGLVPSEMPCYPDHDDNILRTEAGLYPDLLERMDKKGAVLIPGQWRSLWITVNPGGRIEPGIYPVEVIFSLFTGEDISVERFELEILDAVLPQQDLIHTEWFHSDCISTWYGLEVFSEEYWTLVKKYVRTAVEHGINMILTPIFTPPLDTEVGGERPTVQLVDVVKTGRTYQFCFDKLKRWIDMCLSIGIEYFEFSHLFTQWGAKHAPKIIADVNGEKKRLFGWDTDASGDEYRDFLKMFLKALVYFIKEHNLQEKSFFHISDEPSLEHTESYGNAVEAVKDQLKEFPIIDALSNYRFYEKGLVKNPIPSTNHLNDFLENNIPELWTYYCCSQYKKVSNRFFNMPSARNRILGIQLYKFDIKGFLHWGYNFWYSHHSLYPIDPFRVTDAGYAFPSGDAFLVYPGKNGPLESIRMKVLNEALQDLRALKLLEDKIGRDAVIDILEKDLDNPITFTQYPGDAQWLLNKREEINLLCSKY